MCFQEKHILIISADENSPLVKRLGKKSYLPLVRRSMNGVMDLVKRHKINAIIVDRMLSDLDPIEFVLNVRDVNEKIPVFFPEQEIDSKKWELVYRFDGVFKFKNLDDLIHSIH